LPVRTEEKEKLVAAASLLDAGSRARGMRQMKTMTYAVWDK
jgi:hypothetical protein